MNSVRVPGSGTSRRPFLCVRRKREEEAAGYMMSVASQMGAYSASSQLGGSRITIAMVTAASAPPAACVPCVFDAARKEFLYWTPPAEQPPLLFPPPLCPSPRISFLL